MTKEEMVDFVRKNYCNIEAAPLPKFIGHLPTKDRLMTVKQWDALLQKAEESFGEDFADFLEMNMEKSTVGQGEKRKLRFIWLDFDNWEFMYDCWHNYELAYWHNYELDRLPEKKTDDSES